MIDARVSAEGKMTQSDALSKAIDAVDAAMTALCFVTLQAVQADLMRIYTAAEKPALDG